MQDVMNNLSMFFQNAAAQFGQASERVLAGLSAQQTGLILVALLIVIIVLIILLAVRGRKYNEAMDLIDQQVDSIINAKRDAQAMIDQKVQEQQERESQMLEQINQRERTSLELIQDRERALSEKNDELLSLRQFKERYVGIDDAKAEIKRLLGEARDYIDEQKARADREYIEIVGHAQVEAESVRDMSNGLMRRSHEMLKNALDRSREIIEDAKREAGLPIAQTPDSVRQALSELSDMEREAGHQAALTQDDQVSEEA